MEANAEVQKQLKMINVMMEGLTYSLKEYSYSPNFYC